MLVAPDDGRKVNEAVYVRIELTMANNKSPSAGEDVTLNDVIASYIPYCAARNTPRTISLKRTYLRRFVDFVGNVPIHDINTLRLRTS